MNSGSTLKYPINFKNNTREVTFEGEAYFEVAKNTEQPFIVNTGNLQIKVLGTKFNLRSFETEPTIETTLIEGSVAVYKKGTRENEEKNILEPNEMFAYEKNTGILLKQKIDVSLVTIWKDGKYFFYNETFSVIANKLQRSFNVKVKIESEDLKNEVFSGLFDKNRNIYQILDAMKKYRNFD
ncbi:MAG: FecR family protein [Bacteroidales bacterium]|nr:FecR family protein [Bacteroidales bacterium]